MFIHSDHRRHEVAQRLLDELATRARAAGHRVILGRIEASNRASRELLLGANFKSIGIMHDVGEKFGLVLDVEIFERLL